MCELNTINHKGKRFLFKKAFYHYMNVEHKNIYGSSFNKVLSSVS